jgi:hypothetical protein
VVLAALLLLDAMLLLLSNMLLSELLLSMLLLDDVLLSRLLLSTMLLSMLLEELSSLLTTLEPNENGLARLLLLEELEELDDEKSSGCSHIGTVTILPSSVTSVCASALPFNTAPLSMITCFSLNMLPLNVEYVPRVAPVPPPTCQKTFEAWAPLASIT